MTARPMKPFENAFGPAVLADFERASSLEWLETDGLGGYASATACGANTRRYHGLLVAATQPPVGRKVLVSRLDETVHAGGVSVGLGCNQFPGAIHPRGHERLVHFHRGLFPQWTYEAAGVRLRKTVAMLDGEPTTLVLYEVLDVALDVGTETELTLRPFLAGRDDHALLGASEGHVARVDFEGSTLSCSFAAPYPEVFVHAPGAAWSAAPDWWRSFEYARERERGFDFREDLFTPGELRVRLAPGARLGVVISTRDPGAGRDAFALYAAETARRESRMSAVAGSPVFCRALSFAADQFLVRRGGERRTPPRGR